MALSDNARRALGIAMATSPPDAVEEVARNVDQSRIVSTGTGGGAFAVNTTSHANCVIKLNASDPLDVVLPSATGSGRKYTFRLTRAINEHTFKASPATDRMFGQAIIGKDSDGTVSCFLTNDSTNMVVVNGGTRGGLVGDMLEFLDIETGKWHVRLSLSRAVGSLVTPFDIQE